METRDEWRGVKTSLRVGSRQGGHHTKLPRHSLSLSSSQSFHVFIRDDINASILYPPSGAGGSACTLWKARSNRFFAVCFLQSGKRFVFLKSIVKYRVAQKQWIKFSIEKSLVFSSVNLLEILHASTYDILVYIYKVKKSPRMATLNYRQFGNPGRRDLEAHYTIVHKEDD